MEKIKTTSLNDSDIRRLAEAIMYGDKLVAQRVGGTQVSKRMIEVENANSTSELSKKRLILERYQ